MGLTEFILLGRKDVLEKFVQSVNEDKIRTYAGEYYAVVCTLNRKGELVDLWQEGELTVCAEPHSTLEMLQNIEADNRWMRGLAYAGKKVDECILFELSRLTGKETNSDSLVNSLKGLTHQSKAAMLEYEARNSLNKNIDNWIMRQAFDLANALENMSGAFCLLDADTEYVMTNYSLDHHIDELNSEATLLFVEIHR